MTYDLDLSLDKEIDVDRGFLLVTDLGSVRRVQVLKIVGFTADIWDLLASLVCPFWTEWIRGAVEGGSSSEPRSPTYTPEADGAPCADVVDAWVQFFGDSAGPYVDIWTTSPPGPGPGSTRPLTWSPSTGRLWSQLAKDWARAWTAWNDKVQEVAQDGLDAGLTPPGVSRDLGRHTVRTTARASAAEAGGAVVPVAGSPSPTSRSAPIWSPSPRARSPCRPRS